MNLIMNLYKRRLKRKMKVKLKRSFGKEVKESLLNCLDHFFLFVGTPLEESPRDQESDGGDY